MLLILINVNLKTVNPIITFSINLFERPKKRRNNFKVYLITCFIDRLFFSIVCLIHFVLALAKKRIFLYICKQLHT